MQHYLPPLTPEPITIYLGLAGAGTLAVAAIGLRYSRLPEWVLEFLFRISMFLGLFFVVTLLASTGGTLVNFYLPALFDSPWVAIAAIFVAFCLFTMRVYCLHIYASIEILGALATIFICSFTQYGTTSQRAAALLAATYFLIRGLDNGRNASLGQMIVNRIQNYSWKQIFIFPIAIASAMFFAIFVSTWPRISPPYMTNIKGPPRPISALYCRSAFVVCDEVAWREYERLQAGTPEDRAQSYRDTAARIEKYDRELKKRRWLSDGAK